MVAILVVLAGGGKEVKEPRIYTCCYLLEKAIHAVELQNNARLERTT